MADPRSRSARNALLFSLLIVHALSSPVNIPPQNVSDLLIQSALNSLNGDSPTRPTYKGGNLISAQKLLEPPYVVYRLTLNLDTVCEGDAASCPREACAIDLRQHESGVIEVHRSSIQCMYLYPQSTEDEVQQTQETVQDDLQQTQQTLQDQEIIESIQKQIVNQSVELDHEVQTAADQNDKPFIAVRASNTNYCPGCPYELNPSLPGLSAFGDQALDMMDRLGRNDFKHKLVNVLKVTRAVPPGSNVVQYKILLEIGESNCLKTTLIERSECSLQSNIPVRLCLVTFEERPWQQSGRQITNNNCTEPSDLENEVNSSLNPNLSGNSYSTSSSKREQPERVDSVQEVIGKTAHIDQLAQEGKIGTYETLIDEMFENPIPHTTVQPESKQTDAPVTEQPFTKIELERQDDKQKPIGFTDKTKEFEAFLEDFDVPIKEDSPKPDDTRVPVTEEIIQPDKVNTENSNKEAGYHFNDEAQVRVEEVAKRELQPVASKSSDESQASANSHPDSSTSSESSESTESGEHITEPHRSKRSLMNTPESENSLVQKLAQKAISTLDDIDLDDKKRVILGVLDSKKQKIDGILYHLTVKVAHTDCMEEYKNERDCLDEIDGPLKICKVQLHTDEKRPLHSAKVIKLECSNEIPKGNARRVRRAVGALGGATAVSVDNEDIKKYADLGLKKFSENSEGSNEPIMVEITEATHQVVAGSLYKIKCKLGTSDCPKGTKENCKLKADSELKECLITVWSRPWLKEGSLDIKVNCDQTKRRKRSLRGVNYTQKMLELSKYTKHEKLFNEFVEKFNKRYASPAEKADRLKIFRENMRMAEELQRNEQGTAKYGVTMFADLTTEEFKKNYLGLRPELRLDNEIPVPMADIPNIELPTEYDWRHYNAVTPVKNQGQCGSCWAFSVTGNVEGQYAIKHGKLLSLSEQELVDCDTLDEGCNGGLPDNAYRAIETLGGLELESDYPYDAEDEKCHFDKKAAKVSVVSAVNITTDETQMAQWLVKNGPISIGINANAMQFYMGGVSHPFKFLCSPSNLDHGVLIVGYGIHTYPLFHKKLPYWTIKNSWGPIWGEQGYYRVYRGDGTCGLNLMASSAVVA